ncbi:MAG: Smr/MutS family protein [Saprospiraceae bacterium]|nr:Smr/MutS family protein [Saprospiraceae bacterium]
MNLNELWIGDLLSVRSSGRIGKFAGIKDGKARISSDGKIFLVVATNLERVPEKEYFENIHDFLNKEKETSTAAKPLKIKLNHTLDLHIEKLGPHMENENPARILEFQVQQSFEFIRHAIEHKYPHFTIIHGKGQGVLKLEIEHQLKQFHQIKITFSKNGGGAVEVWL